MPLIPFATGTHKGESLAIDTEFLVNLYPHISESGKSLISLISRPGLARLYDFGAEAVRGMLVVSDRVKGFRVFVVHQGNLLEQTEGGAPIYRGSLTTVVGRCYLAWNGTQLLITDGANGYLYDDPGGSFVQLDSPTHGWTLTQPTYCTWLRQYFVVLEETDSSYHISAPANGLAWNAADKAGAEADPDGIARVIANNGELWVLGPKSAEIHYTTGDTTPGAFPFQPKLSATLDIGCASAESVATYNGSIAFLGQARGGLRVYWMAGYTPERISDDALEHAIRDYGTVTDAIGIGVDWEASAYYILTFPTEGVSWLYDARGAQWSQIQTGTGRFAGELGIGIENRNFISDYRDGRVHELQHRQDDDGEPLRVRAVGRTISEDEQWISHRNLEVVVERGTAGQTVDPEMRLRWSNDNGNTWSASYPRTMGKVGEYNARARWNRLGRARNRTYELIMTDSPPKVIVGMVVNGRA